MTNLRSGNLLATKLVAPLPHWQPVARPRLLGLLEDGTSGPLTATKTKAGRKIPAVAASAPGVRPTR